jgi:hypothetical protein
MTAHSPILGGSNAARLLACPASYLDSLRTTVADVESIYAAEGTMLHEVVTFCIKHKLNAEQIRAAEWVNWTLSKEQVEAVAKAIEALDELKAKYDDGSPWKVMALEETLPLPGVTGAFGSVDLIISNARAVIVVDWKFGMGVPVSALYKLADGSEQLNAQVAFYGACAYAKYRRRFKAKQIVVSVVQPRLEPTYSYAETDADELEQFRLAFYHAVVEAMGRGAHRERGEHCRFAICKSICPLWTGAVFDLAILEPTKEALVASKQQEPTKYGAFLSRAMDLAEMAETWAEEIRRQSHVFLSDGGAIKGWKLVPKRGTRQWIDADAACATLKGAGALDADLFTEPEFKSVTQAEAALKRRKITVPGELYHMVSSGTTIARADDARPESTHATVMTNLRQALTSLLKSHAE